MYFTGAEGFERKSNAEFRQFSYIAKGSAERCDQCFIRQKN
ncbi:hypothetical protein C0T31_04585 [Dysgonamonadaceae bacterium]|nr:hypothetical protein C0T31_04585 [Dysgonamonadaceae bacterium]